MRMKNYLWLVVICVPVLLAAQTAQPGHYDGTWTTTMACEASTHMPAYKWTFVGTIVYGNFHGQHGEEGGPGYLVVDGPIKSDGSAKLHAMGTVESGKAGLVTQMKGNKYDYNIEAKFTDKAGTGKRDAGLGILGRPCTFEFTKQSETPVAPPAGTPAQ
jgi:hypothetical protein